MWFLWFMSWIAIAVQFAFASLAVAAGLYYLAELVEEYASVACKIIRILILSVLVVYLGLLLFEDMPLIMTLCGIMAQVAHLCVLKTFPYFVFSSPAIIISMIFVILNHYFAFSHFGSHYYPFSEIMAYFTLCLWLVPFSFFVSLTANDYVLPTQNEHRPLLGDENDVVTNYFSKKGKKFGLLSFFKATKEMILPQRTKKSF
jgi:hypothetical protein